jgi:site-specific DNA recombinase
VTIGSETPACAGVFLCTLMLMRRAAIYCRISDDRGGAGLGVARQEADCRGRAERLGWRVAGQYVDNDLSAYSGAVRPEYRRMLDDLRSGVADAVIAWHTDRLHRSPRELEEFIDVCEGAGVAVETVKAGPVDLSTPAGRAVARTLGAWARYESEHKAERSRRKALELAQSGKLSGGGRPFGYEPDRMTVRESEAKVIRECVRHLLAGEPVRGLVRDLNSRGIPTSTGRQWSTHTLKRMLASGRISGQRDHQPRSQGQTKRRLVSEIVGDAVCVRCSWTLRDSPPQAQPDDACLVASCGVLIVVGVCVAGRGRTAACATSARKNQAVADAARFSSLAIRRTST